MKCDEKINLPEVTIGYLSNLLCAYVTQFCMRPGFFIDFMYFDNLTERYKLVECVLAQAKTVHDMHRPFIDIKV